MFDESEYQIIETYNMIPIGTDKEYVLTKYMIRKSYFVDLLESTTLTIAQYSDYILGYKTMPQFEYIFELFEVDMNLTIVYEIKDWCEENLQEFNMLIIDVVKNRSGMPRQYPLIETPNQEDAFAFKMRWM